MRLGGCRSLMVASGTDQSGCGGSRVGAEGCTSSTFVPGSVCSADERLRVSRGNGRNGREGR